MTSASDLKQFAKDESSWSSGIDPDDYRWSLVKRYPTSTFLERRLAGRSRVDTKKDWSDWFENEVRMADDPAYYRQLEREWIAHPSSFPEIIVAELPDGTIDVGDGWHRVAIAITHGKKTVPAVVGRSNAKPTAASREGSRARTSRLDREISEFLTEETLHRRGLL